MFKKLPYILCFMILSGLYACAQQSQQAPAEQEYVQDNVYTYGSPTSADGTGKFYMGREIAQVMGHLGADWLERSNREAEERTDLLIEALKLENDDVAADIGAGTGYFTFRMSSHVPQGKVLAVDIQPEMLELIQAKMQENGIVNVKTILGTEQSPELPKDSVDLVLMVDAYHEFSYPREMMQNIVKALKPDGEVVLVEYRAEDPEVMIKPKHKMAEEQVVKEMQAIGLELKENKNVLPQQHLMIFVKTNEK